MNYYDKILMVVARDCISNGNAIRGMLEALNFHVELVAVNERKEFDAVFGGQFICAEHMILVCHGVTDGLRFPLITQDANGRWAEKANHLRPSDVKTLRSGPSDGAILALACTSASQDIADTFRRSGFRYYVGHTGYNQIDSMILYCATFYCALRSTVRDDERKEYSVVEAHEIASRVQEFPNGTKGYRLFEIQP